MTRIIQPDRRPTAGAYSDPMSPNSFPAAASAAPSCAGAKLAPGSEFCFTVNPLPGEGIVEMFRRLALALQDTGTVLVKLMVFGSVSAHPAAEEAMRRVFSRIDWPVTWVEGASGNGDPIAGMQAFAFSAGRVERLAATAAWSFRCSRTAQFAIACWAAWGQTGVPPAGRSIPRNTGTSGNQPRASRVLVGRCGADLVLP